MMLQPLRIVIPATLFGFFGLVCECHAQSGKTQAVGVEQSKVASVARADRTEILRVVRLAYQTPAQKYLCSGGAQEIRATVRKRFSDVFSEEVLNEYISEIARCEILASARFGFDPLDTPEAIRQPYAIKFGEPYILQGATLVDVRFNPITQGQPGDEGGAIVYLKKINGSWKIANIESAGYLGANGFRSLIRGYPTVSSDVWSDMDYTKSLTRPEPRH